MAALMLKEITGEDTVVLVFEVTTDLFNFILKPLTCVVVSKKLCRFWLCNSFSCTEPCKANASCILFE